MKVINNRFDEAMFSYTTTTGLQVICVYKPEHINQAAYLATPFGGIDIIQKVNQEVVDFPAGTAHFLEHKLFEGQEDDIMAAFTSLGANVNAYTSTTETVYYFSTTNSFKEPLNLLLDFVTSLSISEESVEKEKGIIIQELSMYEQMPNMRIFYETYQSLYHHHPYKYDIGGSKDSVLSINEAILKQAYQIYYHPTNMVLVVITNLKPQDIFQQVEEALKDKNFGLKPTVEPIIKQESNKVARENFQLEMDVLTPKVTVSFKLPIENSTNQAAIKQQWAMQLLLEAHFSMVNPFYQEWVDQQLLNDSFDIDVDITTDAAHLIFYIETQHPDQFEAFMKAELNKIAISDATLEQLKKRFYGLNLRAFNRHDVLASNIIHYHFKAVPFIDMLDMIESIQQTDINKCTQLIKQSNPCVVILNPFA